MLLNNFTPVPIEGPKTLLLSRKVSLTPHVPSSFESQPLFVPYFCHSIILFLTQNSCRFLALNSYIRGTSISRSRSSKWPDRVTVLVMDRILLLGYLSTTYWLIPRSSLFSRLNLQSFNVTLDLDVSTSRRTSHSCQHFCLETPGIGNFLIVSFSFTWNLSDYSPVSTPRWSPVPPTVSGSRWSRGILREEVPQETRCRDWSFPCESKTSIFSETSRRKKFV